MAERLDRFLARPVVAHLVRAGIRFGERSGPLFAAAVTYFSMLSIVPVVLVSFLITGIAVTTLRPDLLARVQRAVTRALGDAGLPDSLAAFIDQSFSGFGGVGIAAAAIALWVGSGWIGNLRKAIQFQLADDVSEVLPGTRNPILEILANIGIFLVLLVLSIATFAVTVVTLSFNQHFVQWMGLSGTPESGLVVGIVSMALNSLAGTVLFAYIFGVLSGRRLPRREWFLGSLFAGISLVALQSLTGFVTRLFSQNMSVTIFGPVILILLFLNLFATLFLFVAAWIGTAELREDRQVIKPVLSQTSPQHAQPNLRRGPSPARASGTIIEDLDSHPRPDPEILIPQDVAAKGIRIGSALGYGLGAMTGLGLGALVGRVLRRRPRDAQAAKKPKL